MELKDFWAKTEPFQSVVTHGIVSGSVCQYLYKEYLCPGTRKKLAQLLGLPEETTVDFLGYLAALHDIGKIEASFQSAAGEMAERLKAEGLGETVFGETRFRHEQTGAAVMRRIWRSQGQDKTACHTFSLLLGAHHQRTSGKASLSADTRMAVFHREFEERMRSIFWKEETFRMPAVTEGAEGAMEALVLGLLMLSDWIASGNLFSDAELWISQRDAQGQIRQKIREFLRESGLQPCRVFWKEDFCSVWPDIPQEKIRPLQAETEALLAAEKRCSLLLLEAPMGEGKTEAGLYVAARMAPRWGKDGIYYALPTSAASGQMAERMRRWFQDNAVPDTVRLLHAMAWMEEPDGTIEDDSELRQWLQPLRRGLLGQYGVGTMDQAMLGVSKAKYSVLRLLGLSNKVLVMDELHAYDVYMSEFILLLLQWCRALEIPVVMLFATLTPQLKCKLLRPYTKNVLSKGYPQITAVWEDGAVTEHRITNTARKQTIAISLLPVLNCPEKIAGAAMDLTKQGGCICVLMNTVLQAQAVFSVLERFYDGDLLLFHSQFPVQRRLEIEKACIQKFGKEKRNRPSRAILVATQVVEQSLDVDFDAMITATAPMDLLLQRIGRVFRHEETRRPEHLQKPSVQVLVPEDGKFGGDKLVYPEDLLHQAIRILQDKSSVRIPEDLEPLVAEGYENQDAADTIQAGQSQKYRIHPPWKQLSVLFDGEDVWEDGEEHTYLRVKTRLGEESVRIALLEPGLFDRVARYAVIREGRKIANIRDKRLAREVMAQSVSVRKSRLNSFPPGLLDISGGMLLSGIRIFPSENDCCCFPGGGKIRFDEKLGVIIEEGNG